MVNKNKTVRYNDYLVNFSNRCPLKIIVKKDRIVRIRSEDIKDDSVFGKQQIFPFLSERSN
ncbi:MAG: hypothetical protein ACSLEL_02145 [Candidatus Malihini olakiniferum]